VHEELLISYNDYSHVEPAPEDFYVRPEKLPVNSHSLKKEDVTIYTDRNVDFIPATHDLASKIINDYYGKTNTDIDEEKPFSYFENSYVTGAILRKDINKYKNGSFIGETEKIASILIDAHSYKVIEDSIFHYAGALNRNFNKESGIYSNHKVLKIVGLLKSTNGTIRTIPMNIYDDGYSIGFSVDIDTDALEIGENFLCLYTEFDEYDLSDGSCIKLTRINGPLQEDTSHYNNAPPHYISVDGYYVLIDGNRIYYDNTDYTPLVIYDYKYSSNRDYLILDARHYEGGTTPVYSLSTKKWLNINIDYDSAWKKTVNGYRVYNCSSGGYSQQTFKYYDISSSDDSITEKIISDSSFLSCDYKNNRIRIIERDNSEENSIKYFEYSMDSDISTNVKFFEADPEAYYDLPSAIDLLIQN